MWGDASLSVYRVGRRKPECVICATYARLHVMCARDDSSPIIKGDILSVLWRARVDLCVCGASLPVQFWALVFRLGDKMCY